MSAADIIEEEELRRDMEELDMIEAAQQWQEEVAMQRKEEVAAINALINKVSASSDPNERRKSLNERGAWKPVKVDEDARERRVEEEHRRSLEAARINQMIGMTKDRGLKQVSQVRRQHKAQGDDILNDVRVPEPRSPGSRQLPFLTRRQQQRRRQRPPPDSDEGSERAYKREPSMKSQIRTLTERVHALEGENAALRARNAELERRWGALDPLEA